MFYITTPPNCSLPDEFWSRTDSPLPSVIALFSMALFLLFILNVFFYYSGEKDLTYKESFVTGTAAILNAFLIVTLGLILFSLFQSNFDSRVSYEEKIGLPYNSNNRCLQLEIFLGKWEIIQNTEVKSVFENYIIFSRDETITTNSNQLEIYDFSVEFFDKYYEPRKHINSKMPDSIKDAKSVKGILEIEYCVFDDKYCDWYNVNYYFEKFDEQLILFKTDFVRSYRGKKIAVDGEYILLNKMAE